MRIVIFYGLPSNSEGGADIIVSVHLKDEPNTQNIHNGFYQGFGVKVKTLEVFDYPLPINMKDHCNDVETREIVKKFNNRLKKEGLGKYIKDCGFFWYIERYPYQ